ncbi:MAG TPA: FHA domain-containing protein [Blastocatellia bacterium]|nr:FHA domain-containing protein [Blastocatellia bacterium]
MICPVCKSQNIETAKFCGGCGTPLAKSAPPASQASSLITCAQGHVYSSIYQACPYCPQPDRPAQADFATRIEPVAETAIEPLITNIEPLPTITQPPPSRQAPATVVEPQAKKGTSQVRRDYATVVDPGVQDPEMRTGQLPPPVPATTVVPVAPPPPPPQASSPATVVEPITPPQPPPPPVTILEPAAPPPPPLQSPPPQSPPRQAPPVDRSDAAKNQRRTVVVPAESGAISQGRLVGWLVSFSKNRDGVDYRLRAGRNVIGANPSCDIVVDDDAVSSVHASIVWRNGRCFIKDELSSNGTYLNSVEVTEPEQLQSYDQIRVGNMMLTFIALEVNP